MNHGVESLNQQPLKTSTEDGYPLEKSRASTPALLGNVANVTVGFSLLLSIKAGHFTFSLLGGRRGEIGTYILTERT